MKNLFLTNSKKIYLRVFLFILVLAVFGSGFFIMSHNYDLRKYLKEKAPNFYKNIRDEIIYPIFRQRVLGSSELEGIPIFKLILSRKDIAHFSELYRRYEAKDGQEYYNQNNVWRRGELFFEGKKYKIKIKAHGKNPTGHRVGKYISFLIDLRGNNQIYNSNRFSLIIHERIDHRYFITNDMASRFNILKQKQELINLKINDWGDKLYFFEHRLNSSYMEAHVNSSLKLFSSEVSDQEEDKSLIIAEKKFINDFNTLFYAKMLNESMEGTGITKKNSNEILKRYLALNHAIVNGNAQEINSFFDEEYISSFNLVRLILGYIGHGFTRDNLYIFFNFANGKFYPALTRDNVPDYLPQNGMIENKINSWKLPWNINNEIKLPIFHLLSQNDFLRQITYKKLFNFIQMENDYLPEYHKRKVVALQKVYYLGWLKELLRIMSIGEFKDITKVNFEILKKYLNDAKPEINLSVKGKNIQITIKPNSMSGLEIKKSLIQIPSKFANQSFRFTRFSGIKSKIGIKDQKLSKILVRVGPNAKINLKEVFSGLSFFNGLDHESLPQSRKYIISLESDNQSLDWKTYLEEKNIDFEILNKVTGKILEDNSLTVIIKKEPLFNLQSEDFLSKPQKKPHWLKIFPRAYRKDNKIIIPKGEYFINEDLFFPKNYHLILKSGAKLLLAEGVGILVRGAIKVDGSKMQPVIIKAINPKKAFGSVAVLGSGKEISRINYLKLSNGNEKWMHGAYFSGSFALHYQKEVIIKNSEFIGGKADDGVNIKFSKVNLVNNIFKNNFADQIDLDYCVGIVRDSSFFNDNEGDNNGDGLDISGSKIYLSGNHFTNFRDKGLSIGEKSSIFIKNNYFEKNEIGSAVKDFSNAYFWNNNFSQNMTDIQVYQKKIFFGGGRVFLDEEDSKRISTIVEKKSKIFFFPSETKNKDTWISNYPKSITKFFVKLDNIEFYE